MNVYLYNLTLILYLFISLFYLLFFVLEKTLLLKIARRTTAASLALHTLMLGIYSAAHGGFDQWNMAAMCNFGIWLLVVVYSIFNVKYKLKAVGAVVFPSVNILYFIGFFSLQPSSQGGLTQSPWASIHIVLSFLSLSVLLFSFLTAILFFVQEQQIKKKRIFQFFTRLPSLEVLDQTHSKALTIGFVLLTAAIISGALWANAVKRVLFYNDPRQMWTICSWLLYGLFLQGRFSAKWKGRRGLVLSLLGFLVIIFSFVGVRHS